MQIEVTLTHPAAAFAAMMALEDMSEQPPHADGARVWLPVAERNGAVMEAARRLFSRGRGHRTSPPPGDELPGVHPVVGSGPRRGA